MISPGVVYLLRAAPTLLLPPLIVYGVLQYLSGFPVFAITKALWFRFPLLLLADPFALYLLDQWTELSHWLQARRLGAQVLPQVQGRWYIPLQIDVLVQCVKAIPGEYVADNFGHMLLTQGKTVVLRAAGQRKVLTMEPRYVKRILATNFENFPKGDDLFGAATRSVLGVGVFNSDGDLWKFHRTLTRPFFTRDRTSDFKIFDKHANAILEILRDASRTGTPLDIQDVFARFTLDSATEFLIGDCVNSIQEPMLLPGGVEPPRKNTTGHSTSDFFKAFARAQEIMSIRVRTGKIWPLREIKKDAIEEHSQQFRAYFEPIFDKALQRRKELLREKDETGTLNHEVEEGTTFLDSLLQQTDNRTLIRDALVNTLSAGRDTHPEVLSTAREEILQVIGPSASPTYEKLRELKYLRAVLNETLRLFPPVPMNIRESINSDIWEAADGRRYFIPAGTPAAYSVIHMHRDEELWGPDALVFDPMRWIDSRLARLTANPMMFLPFNAGPRICVGQQARIALLNTVGRITDDSCFQFAYNETSFLLVRLLQTFSGITLRPDGQPAGTLPDPHGRWDLTRGRNAIEKIWPKSHSTLYVHGGLWGVMEEA
ncbi:cytochrome P450 monooxygenase pc-1 [Clavulina sp. PMI_390]|nr:cytochrome P450 monooxygenase pc-1 [Clavulina sp. PMI_390]